VDHEPAVPFPPHVSQYAIHKGPTVPLARLGGGRDQREHYSTRISFVLLEKGEPLELPIVLYGVVSNAFTQVNSKVLTVILQYPSDQIECSVFMRVAQGWLGARSPFDFH
jgi:hypothetical protein